MHSPLFVGLGAIARSATPAEPPRTLVQVEAVGLDFVYLGYAVALCGFVGLLLLSAILVVLIGRR